MVYNGGMKGYLRFLILWLLNKHPLSGVQLANELEKRKGHKPSPGTIYPALKDLRLKGLIQEVNTGDEKDRIYMLTREGKKELSKACFIFCRTFYDLKEKIDEFVLQKI